MLHSDSHETGQTMADGHMSYGPKRPNRSIVSKDGYDKRDIVYDRWLPLLQKGAAVAPDKDFKTASWQYYVVKPKQATISEQIYCADLSLVTEVPRSQCDLEMGGCTPGYSSI